MLRSLIHSWDLLGQGEHTVGNIISNFQLLAEKHVARNHVNDMPWFQHMFGPGHGTKFVWHVSSWHLNRLASEWFFFFDSKTTCSWSFMIKGLSIGITSLPKMHSILQSMVDLYETLRQAQCCVVDPELHLVAIIVIG